MAGEWKAEESGTMEADQVLAQFLAHGKCSVNPDSATIGIVKDSVGVCVIPT